MPRENTHLPESEYLSNEDIGSSVREALADRFERKYGDGKLEIFHAHRGGIGVEYVDAERPRYIEEFDDIEEMLAHFFGDTDDDDDGDDDDADRDEEDDA
jgi:hypothetical protein